MQQVSMRSRAIGVQRSAVGSRSTIRVPTPMRPVLVRSYEEEGENGNGADRRRQWPDPVLVKETLAAFPEQGMADIEQARCLFSNGGYTWLDVRSALEFEEVGKVKGSVNVPFVNLKRQYNAETRERVVQKTPNPDFVKLVERKFPDKMTKLLVCCSNGKAYSLDALEELEEAGYENICFVRGGYNRWYNVFDNSMRRRNFGEYGETNDYKDQLSGGDSTGIHATGAGFAKMDPTDRWNLPVY